MKSRSSASEHFEREKARRAKKAGPHTELMAAARREYEALLEAQAKKGKGGRPRKNAAAKSAAKPVTDDIELDEAEVDESEIEEPASDEAHDEDVESED